MLRGYSGSSALSNHSWWCSRKHMGCQGLNLLQSHARLQSWESLFLYYLSGPYKIILSQVFSIFIKTWVTLSARK